MGGKDGAWQVGLCSVVRGSEEEARDSPGSGLSNRVRGWSCPEVPGKWGRDNCGAQKEPHLCALSSLSCEMSRWKAVWGAAVCMLGAEGRSGLGLPPWEPRV